MKRPRLFVSYSHHPESHKKLAKSFLKWLGLIGGLEVHTDEEVASPQGPPEGWVAWMREQIQQADWILVVCNEPYRDSWEKKPSGGRGATYEAALLMQGLYEEHMMNRKLIPVILTPADAVHIPQELRDFTHYRIPEQRETLVERILKGTWLGRFIEGLATVEPGTVTDDVTPAKILESAMELDKEADELPGMSALQKALVNEADSFVRAIAAAEGALELEKIRLDFRRKFCPRAKELFELAGSLPMVLQRIYEQNCLR